MKRWFSWIVAGVVVISILILTTIYLTPEGSFYLVFGWIPFLSRTLPRTSIDWVSLSVGCVAFLLLACVVHFVGTSFLRSSGKVWKLRWSIASTALVVLLFAVGVASVGAIHQVGWMATSPEPVRVSSVKPSWRIVNSSSATTLRALRSEFAAYSEFGNQQDLPNGGTFAKDGRRLHSWATQLTNNQGINHYFFLKRQVDLAKPWNDPVNEDIFKDFHPLLINPELRAAPIRDADGYALSHYAANVRVMGGNYAATYEEMGEHRSRTILIGEVNAHFKPWGHPANWRDPAKGINRSPDGFGGVPGSGGALFLMADGSVKFISENTSLEVLKALSSPRAEDKGDVQKLDAALIDVTH